jgi:hypothetical protein
MTKDEPYKLDDIQIVLRSHMFFKMVQTDWITRTKVNHPMLEITKDNEINITTGGECLIFDILEELQKCFPPE